MFRVFIAMGWFEYEGGTVIGASATLEGAKALVNEEEFPYDSYTIEEHVESAHVKTYELEMEGWV